MKKKLIFLFAVISCIILTSFMSFEKSSSNTKTNVDGFEVIEKVMAYDVENEEYVTMYIFFDKDDGTYACSSQPKASSMMSQVYRNRLYKRCNDRRREFRYVEAGRYFYFNSQKLPNNLSEI